jgi:opacity protein-like surface antigen
MRTLRCLVVGVCAFIAAPNMMDAQARDEEEISGRDLMRTIFGPNWNLFGSGGLSTSGRLLLQRPVGGGERALKRENGFNLGVGAGVDILPRVGLRLSYTYTSSDLAFRTDNGDGSNALDVDDIGKLRSHAAAIEVIRYMLRSRASITPYGSVGFVGAWWMLGDESASVAAGTGSTQFRFGAIASLGLQLRLSENFSARLEAASSSVRNPFTGNESFQAFGGVTVDEPTRVNTTDFRLSGVYYLSDADADRPGWTRGRRRR